MYLVFLLTAMCSVYFVLPYFFAFFFKTHAPSFERRSLFSLLGIAIFMLAVYTISYWIPNIELGNRILHAFGGGFLAMLVAYLGAYDTKLSIDPLRFFVLSVLIVTALGVGNELMEFLLQSTTGLIFSPTPTDTWLDLASSTTGIILAYLCIFVSPLRHGNRNSQ